MNILETLNLSLPTYETTLPFSKKTVKFTPFKVKDIKNISVILEEKNKKLAFIAMVNVIKNNTIDSKDIIEDLCLADAEYLFLQIRSKSVEEKINLIIDNEKAQLHINDVLSKNKEQSLPINISQNITIVLKTPTIKKLLELNDFNKEELIKACIEKFIVKNEIYFPNKFLTSELKEILENLPLSFLNQADSFLKNEPELYAEIKQNDTVKEVNGILNFFTYR